MSRPSNTMAKLILRIAGRHENAGPARLRIRAWLMRHLPGQLTCIEFERFVHDYQEGSLSARERHVFDLHMELCQICRVYFAFYLQAIELGKRICAEDDTLAPDWLPEELVAAILSARDSR